MHGLVPPLHHTSSRLRDLTTSKKNNIKIFFKEVNLLKPNDIYICRTAALTSRRYILNIYSTNIRNEYFKHAA